MIINKGINTFLLIRKETANYFFSVALSLQGDLHTSLPNIKKYQIKRRFQFFRIIHSLMSEMDLQDLLHSTVLWVELCPPKRYIEILTLSYLRMWLYLGMQLLQF